MAPLIIINNLIIRNSSTSPATNANLGGAIIDGIEMVLSANYSHENYWKMTYFYQDPRDSDTGRRIAYVPSERASFSINHGLSQYLISHVDVLWTGKRPRAEGDARDRGASYTTVDIALTLKNIYKNLEIQGTIHNLFDEKYEDPDISGAAQLISGDFPREGISAMLNVSYKFF